MNQKTILEFLSSTLKFIDAFVKESNQRKRLQQFEKDNMTLDNRIAMKISAINTNLSELQELLEEDKQDE